MILSQALVTGLHVQVCIMDDILEHSPAGGASLAPQCLPVLLSNCQAKVRSPVQH